MFGPGYVIGALKESGCEVKLFNFNYSNTVLERIKYEINLQNLLLHLSRCDLVCMTVCTLDLPLMENIIRSIRQYNTKIPILVGGVHPTLIKEQFLMKYPSVNYICVGEGESFIREFIEHIDCLPELIKIDNLGYRLGNRVVLNKIRPPEDLEHLPVFPWHMYEDYEIVDQYGFASVRATRGCPFKCTFCCNSSFLEIYSQGYLRKRPIDDVINDMKYLKEHYELKLFSFADEMLVWDKTYAMQLFIRIKTEINMPFGFMARVEYLDEMLIKTAANCGCKYVGIGVECGNEEFRKNYLNRHMSNQKIEGIVKLLKENDIYVATYNMIGYPVSSERDALLTLDTINFTDKIKPNFAQFSIFYPFPGTKLYDKCIIENLIDPLKSNKNLYGGSILKGMDHTTITRNDLDKKFNYDGFLKL